MNPTSPTHRLAGLDIGTNTFLLLIADLSAHTLTPLFERETVVRLGKGVEAHGNLNSEAMQRGLACLREYATQARAYGCEKILAVGTSALRDAKNREAFLQLAKQETGIVINVISGETEARLSYRGALSNKRNLPAPLAIIDIGGGSTEVVLGTHEQITSARSADIGSVRWTERWLQHDPVLPEEVEVFRSHAERVMRETWPVTELKNLASVVGTAGTITTLAAMAQGLVQYEPDRIDHFTLTLTGLHEIVMTLIRLPIAERKNLPGLNPARADVILAGAMLLETFMKIYGFNRIVVSNRGLRHGVILDEVIE
ncbi:Ppx/GppA family phosphatase [candidate division KSB1 bacterium]|nr:Ppx/GppA family phosphatase [candidate division KSB1 bacterium]